MVGIGGKHNGFLPSVKEKLSVFQQNADVNEKMEKTFRIVVPQFIDGTERHNFNALLDTLQQLLQPQYSKRIGAYDSQEGMQSIHFQKTGVTSVKSSPDALLYSL